MVVGGRKPAAAPVQSLKAPPQEIFVLEVEMKEPVREENE